MHRRSFLTGLGAVICSPAIVRATSLMPINTRLLADEVAVFRQMTFQGTPLVFDEIVAVTRKALVPHLYAQLYEQDAAQFFRDFGDPP
jgi:hypothetical protein